MTEGPDWAPILNATKNVPGKGTTKGRRIGLQEIEESENFRRARTGADVAVAFGGVDTGDDFDGWGWLTNWVFNKEIQLTENTEAIAELADIAAAMNTTVAYVGDLEDMVTAPRSQLVCTGVSGSKGMNILSSIQVEGAGTEDLYVRAMPYIRPGASGNIYYVPVVVDRNGVPDMIRWIGGTDNSIFSGQYYEVALCVYNPTNGNLEKVWGSGDIKNTYANTSTLQEIQIDMGLDVDDVTQRITPGQILFWAHQQYANGFGQQARSIAAIPQGNVARPSTLLLDAPCYVASNYTQGIPSSISLASLSRENRFIPWGAISVKSIPAEGS